MLWAEWPITSAASCRTVMCYSAVSVSLRKYIVSVTASSCFKIYREQPADCRRAGWGEGVRKELLLIEIHMRTHTHFRLESAGNTVAKSKSENPPATRVCVMSKKEEVSVSFQSFPHSLNVFSFSVHEPLDTHMHMFINPFSFFSHLTITSDTNCPVLKLSITHLKQVFYSPSSQCILHSYTPGTDPDALWILFKLGWTDFQASGWGYSPSPGDFEDTVGPLPIAPSSTYICEI